MEHIPVKRGDIVRIAAGLVTVVDEHATCGGAKGINILRHHSDNWYLDSNGEPHEAPVAYKEFIQDGFYKPLDSTSP